MKTLDGSRDSGFTLVELLVVMLVIGVLAGIAIPGFLASRARAHETSAKSDAKQVVQGISAALVDGTPSSLSLASLEETWTLTAVVDGTTETITGTLTAGNSLRPLSWTASLPDVYCVTVLSGQASSWSANSTGLFKGSSCA